MKKKITYEIFSNTVSNTLSYEKYTTPIFVYNLGIKIINFWGKKSKIDVNIDGDMWKYIEIH